MRRIQAFEFCERAETPTIIRESIVELLGQGLRLSPVFDTIAPIFHQFCKQSKTEIILDLGSGSGEPSSLLVEALSRGGINSPCFILSDLFPNLSKMEEVAGKFPLKIKFFRESLDATNVPENIHHQARTIINTFHHFAQPLAEKIIADAIANRKALLIMESFPRNFLNSAAMFPFLHRAYFKSLFQKKNSSTGSLRYLLASPFIGLLGLWDYYVSVRRVYNQKELMTMVKPAGDSYVWEYHKIPYGKRGVAVVFFGIPKS
jgi:hypothetical protein